MIVEGVVVVKGVDMVGVVEVADEDGFVVVESR